MTDLNLRHENHPTHRSGWLSSLTKGMRRVCPSCGEGRLFAGYLTINPACSHCGLAFEPIRADDAPAYFTLFIVGHLVVAGYLLVESMFHPLPAIQAAIWLPTTLFLSLGLLPYIKGATMGAIFHVRAGYSERH